MRLLISSLILSSALLAQAPTVVRPPERENPRQGVRQFTPTFDELKSTLALTDDQLSQLQQMQKDKMAKTQAFYSKMADKQKELNQLLESGSKDSTHVGELMIELAQMRKQPAPSAGDIHERALALLNADQKAKLTKLEEAQKLRPAVDQAQQLALISPPAPTPVPQFGMPKP